MKISASTLRNNIDFVVHGSLGLIKNCARVVFVPGHNSAQDW